MAVIINGKLMNTEADNAFVKEWISNKPKIKVINKGTGETFFAPLIEMSRTLDAPKQV